MYTQFWNAEHIYIIEIQDELQNNTNEISYSCEYQKKLGHHFFYSKAVVVFCMNVDIPLLTYSVKLTQLCGETFKILHLTSITVP